MLQIGNLVHKSVPDDDNEDNNKVEKTWGEIPDLKIDSTLGKCHHHELLAMIGGYEAKKGSHVAGHRGYFLTGYGMLLNMAIYNYAMAFLVKKKYSPIQPPFFMKKPIMAETAQLSDFDEQLYKVSAGKITDGVEDEKDAAYLIATSEQPISAYYRNDQHHYFNL